MNDKIENILRSYFIDADRDDEWGTLKRRDQIMELFQSQHEQDIKAFEEMIGATEENWDTFGDDEMAIARNQLRAELRTKLDQYKNDIIAMKGGKS